VAHWKGITGNEGELKTKGKKIVAEMEKFILASTADQEIVIRLIA